ncbi:MAG TPA: hypothetical protein VHH09_05220 [Acidimicrobiales bacterium]|nr:hypothetical protein [Acidimicrobiales bacterium]
MHETQTASTEGGSARPPGMRLSELLTVRDQTDVNGRLLLEDAAPKSARRRAHKAGIPMQMVSCPHKDTPSRYGGPMNLSAYEALRHDMGDVLDGFAWLTGHYLQLQPTRRSTVRGLFDTSYLGLTLPLVLFYRGRDPVPPHRQMPTFVASMFKASRGVFSAAVDMLNRRGPSAHVSPAEVVRFADEHGHLFRADTRRACAAPTRLIERTIEVILTAQGGDASQSPLGGLVDFGRVWEFYSLQDSFSRAISNYRYLLDDIAAQTGSTDPAKLFDVMVPSGGRIRSFGEVTDGVVRQANDIQRGLNAVLERADDVAELDFEDLLQML